MVKTGGRKVFKGLRKIGRSSSSNEKEAADSHYVLRVIKKQLRDQVRIARVSKDLGNGRDKPSTGCHARRGAVSSKSLNPANFTR